MQWDEPLVSTGANPHPKDAFVKLCALEIDLRTTWELLPVPQDHAVQTLWGLYPCRNVVWYEMFPLWLSGLLWSSFTTHVTRYIIALCMFTVCKHLLEWEYLLCSHFMWNLEVCLHFGTTEVFIRPQCFCLMEATIQLREEWGIQTVESFVKNKYFKAADSLFSYTVYLYSSRLEGFFILMQKDCSCLNVGLCRNLETNRSLEMGIILDLLLLMFG